MTIASEPAVAALAGSMIGGLTTLAVAWMDQRGQARAALKASEARRNDQPAAYIVVPSDHAPIPSCRPK